MPSSTAGCGKPHVRWCGRGTGCNPPCPHPIKLSDFDSTSVCSSGFSRQSAGTATLCRVPAGARTVHATEYAWPCMRLWDLSVGIRHGYARRFAGGFGFSCIDESCCIASTANAGTHPVAAQVPCAVTPAPVCSAGVIMVMADAGTASFQFFSASPAFAIWADRQPRGHNQILGSARIADWTGIGVVCPVAVGPSDSSLPIAGGANQMDGLRLWDCGGGRREVGLGCGRGRLWGGGRGGVRILGEQYRVRKCVFRSDPVFGSIVAVQLVGAIEEH
jgi:hypothetical protein